MGLNSEINRIQSLIIDKFSHIDWSPVCNDIKIIIQNSIIENFLKEGRYGTEKFGGGSLSWKKSKNDTGKTLKGKTADLFQSSLAGVSVTSENGQILIQLGSNKIYAALHQFGGQIQIKVRQQSAKIGRYKHKVIDKKTGLEKVSSRVGFVKSSRKNAKEISFQTGGHVINMPKRPFLVLQDADIEKIIQIMIDYINKLLK